MEIYQEYGLATVKAIPKWIAKVPFLRRLWFNPVFQRNYRNSRVRKLIEPKLAFRIGFVWSLVISVILTIVSIHENDLIMLGFLIIFIALPFVVIYSWTWIRMFFFCLITTPRELQQDIGKDNLNSILTTPISSGGLFFAETLPNFVRGLEVLHSILMLAAGLAIPLFVSLIVIIISPLPVDVKDLSEYVVGTILVVFVLLVAYVLMTLLISIIVGAYAVTMTIFGAITATLVQSFFVLIITIAGMSFASMALEVLFCKIMGIDHLYYLNSTLEIIWAFSLAIFLTIVGTAIIYWACLFTSHVGISALAKARRQGYYKPEFSNAAGLE